MDSLKSCISSIVQLHKLIRIPHSIKELNKILLTNNNRPSVVIGMETQSGRILDVLVDEEVDVVFCVVDEAERGDAARFQAEVFLHPCLRGEGKLALMQALLQVVDVHLVHALEDDQVMLIAFVVPEKQVLAVRGLELAPVGQRLLDGAQRRVELDVELDAKADQRIDDLLLTLT